MLITLADIIKEVLVRNGRSTTDGSLTDSMLQDWAGQSHTYATAYRKWPCTQGRVSTTWSGSEEISFEGYKMDSFRFITIGGKRLQKVNFENYQMMRENEPGTSSRVYSDYGRTLFINPQADVSGTLVAYGQYQPVLDTTDLAAETVFSNWDAEANEAIFEKMTESLFLKERNPEEAEKHGEKAKNILDAVAGRIKEEQYAYQMQHGEGIFKRFDVVEGGFRDDIFKRDRF